MFPEISHCAPAAGTIDASLPSESISEFRARYTESSTGILSGLIGSEGGASMVSGLMGVPFFHILKSRCGPVAVPVIPT